MGCITFYNIERITEAITHYHNSLKKVNRVAHAVCFLFILKDKDLVPVKLEAHEKFTLTWVTSQEILDNWNERNENKDHDHWIYFLQKAVIRAKELGYDNNRYSLNI